jgi:hypothetical protein
MMASDLEAFMSEDRLFLKRDARLRLRVSLATLDRMIARDDLALVRPSNRALRTKESGMRKLTGHRTRRARRAVDLVVRSARSAAALRVEEDPQAIAELLARRNCGLGGA